jgi:glucose/arabinose dehydrogenase
MKSALLSLAFVILMQFGGLAQIRLNETTLDTATIIYGIDIPWEIQWGPDNHIWTTERFGRVSRIDPETGTQDIILDISEEVYQSGESGLLGMVLHPDFNNQPYVYMAYTYRPSGDILEKIVRYTYDGESLINEFVLLDNIQGNTTHDGCRMIILPDTTILFSTGDAQNQPAAQNLNHLSGKFLRLELDGTVPSDNPFAGNPVYSFGHRNAQGLYLAPNGLLYSSEHGPSTDDELNIIEIGRNYGWPNVHGYCNLPAEKEFCDENDVVEPITAWTPTTAVSDIIYYDHPAIPEWNDKILLTTLKNKRLYVMELSEDGTQVVGEEQLFTNWWGRLRDICMAPDGAIYLATNGPSWSNTQPFTHSIVKVWNDEYVSVAENNNMQSLSIKVFPNPAVDRIHISTNSGSLDFSVSIYNATGSRWSENQFSGTSHTMNISELPAGVYFVSISSGNQILFRDKIMISR